MTVGVYGLVALIVKLDDGGLYLSLKPGDGLLPRLRRWLGRAILGTAPYLLRTLSIAGTVAMFVVGGGIVTHGFHWLHDSIHQIAEHARHLPAIGNVLFYLVGPALDGLVGIVAGFLTLALVTIINRLYRNLRDH